MRKKNSHLTISSSRLREMSQMRRGSIPGRRVAELGSGLAARSRITELGSGLAGITELGSGLAAPHPLFDTLHQEENVETIIPQFLTTNIEATMSFCERSPEVEIQYVYCERHVDGR